MIKALQKLAFIAFSLAILAVPVIAYYSEGMIIDTDNFYFEVYNQGNYGYELQSTPYTYSYDSWLYFDDSFRVYNNDVYNYYPSGWYDFSPSFWNYDPYAYSYYSPNYYYYNNAWNYYPGWTSVYGPNYYRSYYYPAFANYYSYPYYANYSAPIVAPTYNVGASYNYPQQAFCSQIDFSAQSVTISAGETRNVQVRLSNNSPMDFRISSFDVYVDGFDVRHSNHSFDSTIFSGHSGFVDFDLDADEDALTDSFSVEVRVNGQFTDGTSCRGNDLSDSFTVNLIGGTNTSGNNLTSGTDFVAATTPNRSTSAIVSRTWADVTPAPVPAMLTAPPVTITTQATSPAFVEGSCTGLDIIDKDFTVESGKTLARDVYLKNFTSENFIIDYATIQESEDFFAAAADKVDNTIYSGGYGRVGLSITGNDVSKEMTGSAILGVRGHLQDSGKTCTASSQVLIHVKGKEAVFSGGFNLEVPSVIEIIGTSGTFSIKAVNTTNEKANVWFDAEQGVISPSFIVVPANSTVEKVISINAFAADSGKIVYRAELPGLEVLDKYSYLSRDDLIVDGDGIMLVSYSSAAEVANGKAEITAEVQNNTASAQEVSLYVAGLPDGFRSESVSAVIAAGEKRAIITTVIVEDAVASGTYNVQLLIEGAGTIIERTVQIVKKPAAAAEDATGFIGVAFAMLTDNAAWIILILVLLMVLYLILKVLQGTAKSDMPPAP